MTEKTPKNLYTLEQAEDEAGKIKEKIDNGEAGDYQSAEEKYQEQIIRDMVDNFDPNKLADIPAIYHKEIALKLIEAGEGWYVAQKIEKFEGLDKEIALKLIESREGEYVAKNLEKFEGLDKEIALKLIEAGVGWYIAKNPEKFQGLELNKEIALKLIESRQGWYVAQNPEKFQGLELNKEIALKLIESREGEYVAKNLEKFEGLDKEIALKLLESDWGEYIAQSLDKFQGLDKEIALKLIEAGVGWYVAKNPEKFQGLELNKEIALKLIESEEGEYVAKNLEKFQKLDLITYKKIMLAFINSIKHSEYSWQKEIDKFPKEIFDDEEVLLGLIDVINLFNLNHLPEKLSKKIALKMVESGQVHLVNDFLDKFYDLDVDFALQFFEEASMTFEEYRDHDDDGNEVMTEYCVGDDYIDNFLKNIEKFPDLLWNKKVIVKLIELNKWHIVEAHISKFFTPEEWEETKKRVEQSFFCDYSELYYYDQVEDKENKKTNEIYKETFEFLKKYHRYWNDQENIAGPFEEGGEYFGYDKMFKYVNKFNYHDTLYNFRKIVALAKQSGLKPGQFYGQILKQVAMDYAVYGELDNEICSYQLLNSIADSVDLKDFENIIREASRYQDVEALQKLLANFEKAEDVFENWKNLRKYYELIQLLGRAEVLEQLQHLKKEPGKEKLYKYVETLAFHPNIDMRKVFEFWQEPESFLGIKEDHASDFHEMKKPSNYIYIPHLDLSAEEMRDALVEGDLDRLQAWKPLQIEYEIPENLDDLKKEKPDLRSEIIRGLGSMKKGIEGEAKDAKKLFKELNDLFKKRKLKLTDYLQSESFPLPHDLKEEIKNKLYNVEIGIKEAKNMPTSKFRARINLKSDPNGIVAGNDTACCMPFGSGKNNVYTFNPICALFTLEKKINNKWRTIAQSVMTKDADIKMKIPEILEEMEKPGAQIHQIVPEEALIREKSIMTADNVEVAPNFKSNPNAGQILEKIYRDFFREYANLFSQQDNLDKRKLIIGKNYSDALTHLRQVDNTFAPLAPVGYSDNIGEEALMLNLEKSSEAEFFVKREVKQEEKLQREDDPGIKAKNISPLTFEDALHVAYLEGKIYDGTSLLQGLHNMENALIAKDINNTAKERKNLSFKYVNEKGKVGGYILAYEGISNGESVIYITDLAASPEEKMAGGRLILAFMEAYKKNYIEKDKFVPILAEARDKTSYPIIKKNLVAMAKKLGVNAVLEELDDEYYDGGYDDDYDDYDNSYDDYDESGNYGTEKMHRILIRMEK